VDKKPILAIMRPETYTDASEKAAAVAGFQPFSVPVVAIKGMRDEHFDGFVHRVLAQKTDYVIFTSANGIKHTLINLGGGDVEQKDFLNALKKAKIVAIGPTTKKELESIGLLKSLVPGEYSSEGLVNDLKKDVSGKIVDIPRSFYGSPVLVKGLKEAGATVHETHVYTLDVLEGELQEELIEKTINGEIDAFAFTSSMMVRNFIALADKFGEKEKAIAALNDSLVGAIGYPTAQTIEEYGIEVEIIPKEFTFEALVGAMKEKMNFC
jgi:uroporphyrinogen-III synthase